MKQTVAVGIGLALWALIITMFACGGGSGGNVKPPVVTPPPTWSIRLTLPASQVPREAQWRENLWQVLAVLDRAGAKPKPLVITVKDGVACCYQKAFVLSKRFGNTGTMWFYPLAVGPEPHYGSPGAMNTVGWPNGLGWELAHVFGCVSGEDICNDNNYRTEKWRAVDREIYTLPWIGPPVTF